MKKPYKPYEPSRPTAPSKTWKRPFRISIDHHGGKSLLELRKQVPENINDDNIFITIEDDSDYYSGNNWTTVYLEYYIEEDNLNYNRQIKDYEQSLKKYHKKCEEYKPKFQTYLEEKKKYDEWFKTNWKEQQLIRKQKEIVDLKKRLAKLEKKK
jgi:hypothetical protein